MFPGSKGGRCLGHVHVPNVLKSGSLKLLEPSGPVQACNGIALLPTPFAWLVDWRISWSCKNTATQRQQDKTGSIPFTDFLYFINKTQKLKTYITLSLPSPSIKDFEPVKEFSRNLGRILYYPTSVFAQFKRTQHQPAPHENFRSARDISANQCRSIKYCVVIHVWKIHIYFMVLFLQNVKNQH